MQNYLECFTLNADCCVEKGVLHNKIYPSLRAQAAEQGYELHIVDLHWKTALEKQQDHEFPELCLEELSSESSLFPDKSGNMNLTAKFI